MIGYITYRTLIRTTEKAAITDLVAVIGAVGGGAVTALFDPGTVLFAMYYLAQRRDPVPQLPPEVLAERLPLLGWLIYETSLDRLQRITAAFESLSGNGRTRAA